jgi:hypothetical protein
MCTAALRSIHLRLQAAFSAGELHSFTCLVQLTSPAMLEKVFSPRWSQDSGGFLPGCGSRESCPTFGPAAGRCVRRVVDDPGDAPARARCDSHCSAGGACGHMLPGQRPGARYCLGHGAPPPCLPPRWRLRQPLARWRSTTAGDSLRVVANRSQYRRGSFAERGEGAGTRSPELGIGLPSLGARRAAAHNGNEGGVSLSRGRTPLLQASCRGKRNARSLYLQKEAGSHSPATAAEAGAIARCGLQQAIRPASCERTGIQGRTANHAGWRLETDLTVVAGPRISLSLYPHAQDFRRR